MLGDGLVSVGEQLRYYSIEWSTAASLALVLIGLIGFALTVYQLRVAQRTLKATNAYQIQRDARELGGNFYSSGLIRKIDAGGGLTKEEEEKLHGELWRMFNFYLAVYRQQQNSGITKEFARAFADDFRGFVRKPAVCCYWHRMVNAGNLSSEHVQMMESWSGRR